MTRFFDPRQKVSQDAFTSSASQFGRWAPIYPHPDSGMPMPHTQWKPCTLALISCGSLAACGGATQAPKPARAPTALAAKGDQTHDLQVPQTPLEKAQQNWAKRAGVNDVVASIAEFHAVAEAIPDDPRPWLQLAEAQALLGHLYGAEKTSEGTATTAFEQGLIAARAAQKLSENAPEDLQLLAAYWEAENLDQWARHAGFVERVDHEVEVTNSLKTLQTHSATSRQARRSLARMLSKPATIEHQNLPEAKALFEALITEDPWDLSSRTAFAATYAVAAQDRAIFEDQLREIVERTSNPQGNALDKRLAARAASQLLRDAPSLFE